MIVSFENLSAHHTLSHSPRSSTYLPRTPHELHRSFLHPPQSIRTPPHSSELGPRVVLGKSKDIICEVLKEIGICNLDGNELTTALRNFKSYLLISTQIENHENICEGQIHIALAYTRLGQLKSAEEHLLIASKHAEDHGLDEQQAVSERYIGEFYMNHSWPEKATPHLTNSFNIFLKLGELADQEETRGLQGISAGKRHLVANCMKY